MICVMSMDFLVTNRKGRTLHQALVVVIANEQLRCLMCHPCEMRRIPIAHFCGKATNAARVIYGIDWAKHLSRQSKDVANK